MTRYDRFHSHRLNCKKLPSRAHHAKQVQRKMLMRSTYSVSTTRLARTMALAALTISSLVGAKLVVAAPITVGANFSGPERVNDFETLAGRI